MDNDLVDDLSAARSELVGECMDVVSRVMSFLNCGEGHAAQLFKERLELALKNYVRGEVVDQTKLADREKMCRSIARTRIIQLMGNFEQEIKPQNEARVTIDHLQKFADYSNTLQRNKNRNDAIDTLHKRVLMLAPFFWGNNVTSSDVYRVFDALGDHFDDFVKKLSWIIDLREGLTPNYGGEDSRIDDIFTSIKNIRERIAALELELADGIESPE